ADGESVCRAARMSKSLRNVGTPDDVVARHGADTLRVYELFMAPFDQDVEWSEAGILGARRFLRRVWDLVATSPLPLGEGQGEGSLEERRLRHRTVKRVTEDLAGLRFNTAIAALMELTNALADRAVSAKTLETLVLL